MFTGLGLIKRQKRLKSKEKRIAWKKFVNKKNDYNDVLKTLRSVAQGEDHVLRRRLIQK